MRSRHVKMSFQRLCLGLVCLTIASTIGLSDGPATAAGRQWLVTAECSGLAGGSSHPKVRVTIENQTGLLLHVAYAGSFATSPAVGAELTGLRLADPGPLTIVDIRDGATVTVNAPWAGGDVKDSTVVVALVVTSGGIALPNCGSLNATAVRVTGPLPTVAGEEGEESAMIAAQTIGQLEAWRAYGPLYALLHPDARAQFSFEQIACWYVDQYGLPGAKGATTIDATTVDDVSFVNWTWAGGLTEYTGAAEVTVTQSLVIPPGDKTTTTYVEHLVRVNGVWRWFFGTAVDSTAHRTESCGLPNST